MNYDTLIQLWKKQGSNLLCKDQLAYHRKSEQKINAGESITLLDEKGEGAIGSLKFYLPEINEQHLQDVWIHMFWDAHQQTRYFLSFRRVWEWQLFGLSRYQLFAVRI